MSIKDQARDLSLVSHAIHAVFVYAACTEEGFVKVGISGAPFERIYQIHTGSPSPVKAALWTWIGSYQLGRRIEKMVKQEWIERHTRGEWYRFDYSKPGDKQDFHDTLSAVVEVVTGKPPTWERLGPEKVAELVKAGAKWEQAKKDGPRPRPSPMDFRRR